MNTKKSISATLMALVIAALSSCGEPNVISNTPDPNGIPNLKTTAATAPPETSAFDTTTTEDEQTGQEDVSAPEVTEETEPDPYHEELYRILSDKAAELEVKVFGYASSEDGMLAALGTDNGDTCDIYLIRRTGTELIRTLPRSLSMTEVITHTEEGVQFLIVYEKGAVGRGFPATVMTIKDGSPVTLSLYEYDSGEYPALYYYPAAGLVCMRGAGTTIGSNNVIPYHWDGNGFVPYRLRRITAEQLAELDTGNAVINASSAASVYRRENGLVHVNYLEMSELKEAQSVSDDPIASITYVYEDGKLRRFNAEKDIKYGFFNEHLPVTDNIVSGGAGEVSGTDSQMFEIQG